MRQFEAENLFWIREPERWSWEEKALTVQTQPGTDLWQRTYYGFQNDNAPVFQMETEETFFSFTVRTEFDSKHRFDQCGVAIYLDSENWLKASIEYENDRIQRLGSVVTNQGYSDWATTDIPAAVKSMWYRLSRRESDFCIECSEDGEVFRQMRICHLTAAGTGKITFGVYACSPEQSSFQARFSRFEVSQCRWLAHE